MVAGANAVVELVSGVGSLILQYYTNGCSIYDNAVETTINDGNTDGTNPTIPEQPTNTSYNWCKNLDTVLFWMEIASGSVDALSGLMVRKASKKMIDDGDIPVDFPNSALQVISEYADDTTNFLQAFRLERREIFKNKIDDQIYKSNLNKRGEVIPNKSFIREFTDAELDDIIEHATDKLLNKREIEDFLFIACREEKRISATNLKTQMTNWKDIIEPRGYPFTCSESNFDDFSNVIRNSETDFGFNADNVFIQGSALRRSSPTPEDIDIALCLDQENLEAFIENQRVFLLQRHNHNNPMGNVKYRKSFKNLKYHRDQGKIPSDFIKNVQGENIVDCLMNQGILNYTSVTKVNFSVIVKNRRMDIAPFIKIK
ncbi:Uncharacterised protein [Candidatus Venteria ishoeyi]|uniref:Uncharacterized protein n=2 Tax=Candidatus Venteria ishoeyi TaxID=1899563 RepID=A0A1H6F8N6_9GAMM|nr:Uncharacterised protein [Candidatus Venteria ishoeyi]